MRSWNALRARGPTTVSTHRLRQQEARPETTLRRRAAHHRGAPAGPAGALPLPHSGSAASAPRGPSGLAAAPGQYLDFARGGCSQSPRGCTPPSCLAGSGRWRWDYRHLPPLQAFDLPENSSCVWGNLADERPPWAVLPGGPRHCPPGRHEAEGGEDAWAEWPPGPTVREVPGAAGVKDASAPPCSASSSAERASLLMPVLPEPRAHMDPAARGSHSDAVTARLPESHPCHEGNAVLGQGTPRSECTHFLVAGGQRTPCVGPPGLLLGSSLRPPPSGQGLGQEGPRARARPVATPAGLAVASVVEVGRPDLAVCSSLQTAVSSRLKVQQGARVCDGQRGRPPRN